MGTRSLIHFVEDDKTFCTIYRQFDGYFDGRGAELADFLAGVRLTNGFALDDKAGEVANGMGDLAAQWIVREKGDQIGNVYIQSPGDADEDDIFIEYEYWVSHTGSDGEGVIQQPGKPWLKAKGSEGVFEGEPKDFRPWFESLNDEEDEVA